MNVAFIPVRGGSKSIPYKNIKELCGHPLVWWVTKAASDCPDIDRVYVATDDALIARTVNSFMLPGVEVIDREAYTATDTATTESAMLDFAGRFDFDSIVLIQATSPLLTAEDLNGGFALYREKNTDSVLSVVRQKRFIWDRDEDGVARPVNYDQNKRPRRQEFDGYLVENGAFYITGKEDLIRSGNRISGVIRAYEMCEESYLEIDEPADWMMIGNILRERQKGLKPDGQIPTIKMFLTDCDGCLTDGGMYYSENGDETKKFCAQDGMGFQLLKQAGILTGIITGETRILNERRAQKLKLDIYEHGIKDKLEAIRKLCEQYQIPLDEVAYVGDDLLDLEVVRSVGYGCSVANGVDIVKQSARYVSHRRGGDGAVREIIDLLLDSMTVNHVQDK